MRFVGSSLATASTVPFWGGGSFICYCVAWGDQRLLSGAGVLRVNTESRSEAIVGENIAFDRLPCRRLESHLAGRAPQLVSDV